MQSLTYTDYALRVLIYVATYPDTPVPASASGAYGISLDLWPGGEGPHAPRSIEGDPRRRGGLALARPASEIRVGDVASLFERGRGPVECFGTAPLLADRVPMPPARRFQAGV